MTLQAQNGAPRPGPQWPSARRIIIEGTMIHMTLEREQLLPCDRQTPRIEAGAVLIGVRVGLAFRVDSDEIYRDADPWFCVQLNYPELRRADSSPDFDQIITNGDEYWRVRRSLGKSPIGLTPGVIRVLEQAIAAYLNPQPDPERAG